MWPDVRFFSCVCADAGVFSAGLVVRTNAHSLHGNIQKVFLPSADAGVSADTGVFSGCLIVWTRTHSLRTDRRRVFLLSADAGVFSGC